MTDAINIKIDDSGVMAMIERLHSKMRDITPAMQEVGELVRTSVIRNFEEGGRYSESGNWRGGTKTWQPLSIATLFAGRKASFAGKRGRFKKGVEDRFKNRKTLIKSGVLMGSITYNASSSGVTIGPGAASHKYAAIHQFGGKAGRGHKVNIPARPFLVVQDEDLVEIKRVLAQYLTGGMR